MHTNRLKFTALFLTTALLASSCDDDETKTLAPDQAKSAMQTVDSELASTLEDFANAEGLLAIEDLAYLTDDESPFGSRFKTDKRDIKKNLKKSLGVFRNIFTPKDGAVRTNADEPFDFDSNLGVYTWSPNGFWVKTASTTAIKLIFPTEGSTTNNAEFILTNYEEEATPNGDEAYSPTAIEAELKIDGTKVASLDLEARYGANDEPNFADIVYFLAPFSFEVHLDDTKSSESSYSETLLKDNKVVIGAGVTVLYSGSVKIDSNIKTLKGYVQLLTVKFDGTIDVAGASSATSSGNPNDYIVIKITIDGDVAGEIVLVDDEPYIEYTDGSTQSLSSIFNSLSEALDDLDLVDIG